MATEGIEKDHRRAKTEIFKVEQSLFRPEHKPKRGQYQAGYPKIHRSQELMGQKIIQGTRQAWQGLSAWVESEGMHELCTYSVDI
jgi:hypothetical protein